MFTIVKLLLFVVLVSLSVTVMGRQQYEYRLLETYSTPDCTRRAVSANVKLDTNCTPTDCEPSHNEGVYSQVVCSPIMVTEDTFKVRVYSDDKCGSEYSTFRYTGCFGYHHSFFRFNPIDTDFVILTHFSNSNCSTVGEPLMAVPLYRCWKLGSLHIILLRESATQS